MTKPVDKVEFWQQRIGESLALGDLRLSVFRGVRQDKWTNIDYAHSRTLREYIGPGDVVLDAGCGYGRACEFMPGAIYIGVDFCNAFIQIARRQYPEKVFYQGDLTDLKCFGPESFDWAVCISIKAMMQDNLPPSVWQKAKKELSRVTKKGIICLEFGLTKQEIFLKRKGAKV